MNDENAERYFTHKNGDHRHPVFWGTHSTWAEPVYDESDNRVGYIFMSSDDVSHIEEVSPEKVEAIEFDDGRKSKRPATPPPQPTHKIIDNKPKRTSRFDLYIVRIAFLIALITVFPVSGMLSRMTEGIPLAIAFITIEGSIFVAALIVLGMDGQ